MKSQGYEHVPHKPPTLSWREANLNQVKYSLIKDEVVHVLVWNGGEIAIFGEIFSKHIFHRQQGGGVISIKLLLGKSYD